MSKAPPPGMASRAFRARFKIASSSWLGSARAGCKSGCERTTSLNLGANRLLQNLGGAVDQTRYFDRPGLQLLSTSEGEQMPGQRGAAFGRRGVPPARGQWSADHH